MEALYYNPEYDKVITLEMESKIHEVGTDNNNYTFIYRNSDGPPIKFSVMHPKFFIEQYSLVFIGEI